jgi:hypothetical protein
MEFSGCGHMSLPSLLYRQKNFLRRVWNRGHASIPFLESFFRGTIVNINILILALMLICGSIHQAYSCTCGHVGIEKEVERAFDIVVGKIVSERADDIVCEYSLNNKTYESFTSFAYSLESEFSYKGKLEGITTILGGKGGGDCGGIFEVEKEYLIVVFKCDKI